MCPSANPASSLEGISRSHNLHENFNSTKHRPDAIGYIALFLVIMFGASRAVERALDKPLSHSEAAAVKATQTMGASPAWAPPAAVASTCDT